MQRIEKNKKNFSLIDIIREIGTLNVFDRQKMLKNSVFLHIMQTVREIGTLAVPMPFKPFFYGTLY